MDLQDFAESLQPNANERSKEILSHLLDKMDCSEGVTASLRSLYYGYIDSLGVSTIVKEAAGQLQKAESERMRAILKDALDLAHQDMRRIPPETLSALAALGMPPKVRGRATSTYRGAYLSTIGHDWLRGSARAIAKAFGGSN